MMKKLRDVLGATVAICLFILAHGYVDSMELEQQAMDYKQAKQDDQKRDRDNEQRD